MSRRGFTLIELVVSLAILGLTLQVALPRATAWRRQSALRKATTDVARLLRRASLESRRQFLPYRIQIDPDRRRLEGSRSVLDPGQGESRWETDRSVLLESQLRMSAPARGATWIFDRGCPEKVQSAEPADAEGLRVRLETSGGGLTLAQQILLEDSGALRILPVDRSAE